MLTDRVNIVVILCLTTCAGIIFYNNDANHLAYSSFLLLVLVLSAIAIAAFQLLRLELRSFKPTQQAQRFLNFLAADDIESAWYLLDRQDATNLSLQSLKNLSSYAELSQIECYEITDRIFDWGVSASGKDFEILLVFGVFKYPDGREKNFQLNLCCKSNNWSVQELKFNLDMLEANKDTQQA